MAILPDTRLARLEFFEAHSGAWTTHAANIGLSISQMTTLVSLITAARSSYNASQVQREASRAATQTWYDNLDALSDKGADYLKAIKAYAATTGNPGVFGLAQIPPPKAPSPTPAPSTPTNLTATLRFDGAIQLSWKASIANGTAFTLWRKLNLTGQAFEQIATISGETSFVDATLPAGAQGSAGPGVFYQVIAHRLGQSSPPSEPAIIRFGSVDGGNGEEGLKIAA